MSDLEPSNESHPRPEASRQAILRAAISEFAEQGEAGARMDAIARTAGVNKALLHYYFGTKEALYGKALEQVFTERVQGFLDRLQGPGTPGERLLRHYVNHFDRLAASGTFARMLGHEMLRARSGEPSRIFEIVHIAFGPLLDALRAVLAEGMASGELRQADPDPLLLSLTGANVFYFISAPVFKVLSGTDPRDPERLRRQRLALLEFAATVLFSDPGQGRQLALRIHAETPGPQADCQR